MIQFFKTTSGSIIATDTQQPLSAEASDALSWLFSEATALTENKIEGYFVGPRREMISPWSTNAVEIAQNMNITGLRRIEEYFPVETEDA